MMKLADKSVKTHVLYIQEDGRKHKDDKKENARDKNKTQMKRIEIRKAISEIKNIWIIS